MKRLEEILKRCEAATPGPWRYDCGNGDIETEHKAGRVYICHRAGNYERRKEVKERYSDEVPIEVEKILSYDNESDCEHIAHARTDLPLVTQALMKAVGAMKYAIAHEQANLEINQDVHRHDRYRENMYHELVSALAEIEKMLAGGGE